MGWVYLVTAGILEIGFTTCLKESNNFTNWRYTVGFFVFSIFSFFLLSQAMQTIRLGTAYAVWTGIGAAGTAIVGIFLYKDPATFGRLFFLMLLIASIVGLKFFGDAKP